MSVYDPLADYARVGKIAPKLKPESMEPYTPHPTKREYQFGEILRYFARFGTHKSSIDITEISNTTYAKLTANKLYSVISIRWRIVGKLDDEWAMLNPDGTYGPIVQITEGLTIKRIDPDLTIGPNVIRLYTGVVTANKLSVALADEDMPGIKDYLTNYIRFWKFNANS